LIQIVAMPPQAAPDAGFAASGASSGAANEIAFDSIITDGARPVRSGRRPQIVDAAFTRR
jgi:hypothetical protein